MLKDKLIQLKKVLGVPDKAGPDQDTIITDEPVIKDEDGNEHVVNSIEQITATGDEEDEMNNVHGQAGDASYIKYSAEVVGFDNRELQWNAYRMISSYADSDSIIDFGCGRGDFSAYWKSEHADRDLDYIGIDLNEPLINAGRELYPEETILVSDWFSLDTDLARDWAINVGSSNLRYDADITMKDLDYTKKTINAMYNHCNRGVVVALASKYTSIEDDLINYDPGNILNWAKEEFGNVAIDHSMGDDVFVLIIYKV
jgi:hypothetical protein